MSKKRIPTVSDHQHLQDQIDALHGHIKRLSNNQFPTLPQYDETHFPLNPVRGQVVLDPTTKKGWAYTGEGDAATWWPLGGSGALPPWEPYLSLPSGSGDADLELVASTGGVQTNGTANYRYAKAMVQTATGEAWNPDDGSGGDPVSAGTVLGQFQYKLVDPGDPGAPVDADHEGLYIMPVTLPHALPIQGPASGGDYIIGSVVIKPADDSMPPVDGKITYTGTVMITGVADPAPSAGAGGQYFYRTDWPWPAAADDFVAGYFFYSMLND